MDEIDGVSLGTAGEGRPLVVFVEDDLHGETVDARQDSAGDWSDYEVEAYQVVIDEETRVVTASGEELAFADSGLERYMEQEVLVRTSEPFEREVRSDRDGYIMRDQSLLPAVRAEELVVEELGMEHFHAFVTANLLPSGESPLLGLITAEAGSGLDRNYGVNRSHFHREIAAAASDDTARASLLLEDSVAFFQVEEELDPLPQFLLYDADGFIEAYGNWEDLLEAVAAR
ncbi:hypothetical protein [Alkalicoccus chagannorensis]|uniref:hypothetical protein n=1 Tax=Alkalicoccus chagannorensis TaxID=427072 RepID=UPI0012EBA440|nr:hypothetical protein [Alkalicoccus chagannorensis]